MADETVNQEDPKQQPASDATTVNNGGSGAPAQGSAEERAYIQDRVRRAEESALKKALAELNVTSLEDAKAALSDYQKRKDSEMSEVEKERKAAEKYKLEAEAARAERDQIAQQRIQDKVDGALRAAATAARAIDPTDVLLWLRNHAAEDVAKVVDENGNVDEGQVKKLMERTRKDKAHYFQAGGPGSPSSKGGQNPDPSKTDKPKDGKSLFRL